MENVVEEWKVLVIKEDESTSPESHEMTKQKVVKTIPEMASWGEMYEDFDIAKVTPMSKVVEYIIQLNKEIEATIVNKKIEKKKWCPRCYCSTTTCSSDRMAEGITNQSVAGRVKLDFTKTKQLLGRQPKRNFLFLLSFSLF